MRTTAKELPDANRRITGLLLLRATVWILLITPLAGALAGTIVAFFTFRSVSIEFWFVFAYGGPLGAIFGVLFGLVAAPFVVNRSLWNGALILFIGTVLGGIFPAIAEIVPIAFLGSLCGGFAALLLLIAHTVSDTGDSKTPSDEVGGNL